MGLAIARRQVETLGGRLELESTPGRGSRFSFTIPLPLALGEVAAATIAPGPASGAETAPLDALPAPLLDALRQAVADHSVSKLWSTIDAVGDLGAKGRRMAVYLRELSQGYDMQEIANALEEVRYE